MLNTVFGWCKQFQVLGKKQKVDPAASNSETFADLTVFVYPINLEYEEKWRQHTACPSPTPMVNGCVLPAMTLTQISD